MSTVRVVGKPLVAPHLVEQPLAREDLAPMLDQVAQEVELLARQPDLDAGAEGLAGAEVEPRVGELEDVHPLPRAGPAQDGADPRQQLRSEKGFVM